MKTKSVRKPSIAKAKPRPKRVSGFIVRDISGILAVVPGLQPTFSDKGMAFDYAESNKILKVFLSRKNEDIFGFAERLYKLVKQMQQAEAGQ